MNHLSFVLNVPQHNLPLSIDVTLPNQETACGLVLFAHGFKGFKDWGHWHLIAQAFAQEGFAFVKFNFSHNGTALETPLDFSNLEAFGENTFSLETVDMQTVLDWCFSQKAFKFETDTVCTIGHSRGGPIALHTAASDVRVTQLITWAAVYDMGYAWEQNPALISTLNKEGVYYVFNGRTQQNMPINKAIYKDYIDKKHIFSTATLLQQLSIPYLILHGDKDPAVPLDAALKLKEQYPGSQVEIVAGANHVFGGAHPWYESELPTHSKSLVANSINFIKKLSF